MSARASAALLLVAASAGALPASETRGRAPIASPASMPATADDVAGMLATLDAREHDAQRRIASLDEEEKRSAAMTVARGRAYVRLAKAGLLPVGGGFSALVDHASKLERLRRALARDLERGRQIITERAALAKSIEDGRTNRGLLDSEREALERSHAAIQAAEERERAFRRAFMGSFSPGPHTAVYGSGLGPLDPTDLAGGFATMKGRLPFPIAGRAEIRRVKRASADGVGLEMSALVGTTVRAVYPGRVAFSDTYADYGRTVIIDHGTSHFTLSGNLGSASVRAGDEVGAGDAIGTVGTGPDGPALYLEVRIGARTVDPGDWFGI